MYSPISVCIPAYNEGKTIGNTLDSIINQDFAGEMEILVCANACTDNTEQVVRDYSKRFQNISLISTRTKGKPNAWNILREASSSDYLFFADGDVIIHKDSIRKIYNTLESNDIIAVGAKATPVTNDASYLTRLLAHSLGLDSNLSGALYGFKKDRLSHTMAAQLYASMPKTIINEDMWLSALIGKADWNIEQQAKVYYRPPNIKELLLRDMRIITGHKQMISDYSHLLESNISGDKLNSLYEKYCGLNNIGDRINLLASIALRISVRAVAHMALAIKDVNPIENWETCPSTKIPFIITEE